jgi:hypothetical protein
LARQQVAYFYIADDFLNELFKQGAASPSTKLPYDFMGQLLGPFPFL